MAEFHHRLESNSFDELVNIVETIRRIISQNEQPPIEELFKTGVIPHVLRLLDRNLFRYERLMRECSWIIANIASSRSDHINHIVELDAIQKAFDLLDHNSEEVKDNAVWILSNIAGDSLEYRDLLIKMGIVAKLISILDGHKLLPSFLGNVSWLMKNLCRGKPYPNFYEVFIGDTENIISN